LALAEPGPALALVQLMQVSRGLTWRTLALAPPGGAWVTPLSWRLLAGADGPTGAGIRALGAGTTGPTGNGTKAWAPAGCAWFSASLGAGAGACPRPAARAIPPPRSSEAVAAATTPVRTRLLIADSLHSQLP
jgi:hypothetical protein